MSRKWKISRKESQPQEVLEKCEHEYKEQQKKTSIMSGMKKGTGELKKIVETKIDGKKFWNMIKRTSR